jgi:hypothetical protein
VVDITEKVRKARLRWYGHVTRRDEEGAVRRRCGVVDIAEKCEKQG